MQVHTFYLGLNPVMKNLVITATGGSLMNKTEDAAFDLLEHMEINNIEGRGSKRILRREAPNRDSEAIRALTE